MESTIYFPALTLMIMTSLVVAQSPPCLLASSLSCTLFSSAPWNFSSWYLTAGAFEPYCPFDLLLEPAGYY
jgi:hypothetical protein